MTPSASPLAPELTLPAALLIAAAPLSSSSSALASDVLPCVSAPTEPPSSRMRCVMRWAVSASVPIALASLALSAVGVAPAIRLA